MSCLVCLKIRDEITATIAENERFGLPTIGLHNALAICNYHIDIAEREDAEGVLQESQQCTSCGG